MTLSNIEKGSPSVAIGSYAAVLLCFYRSAVSQLPGAIVEKTAIYVSNDAFQIEPIQVTPAVAAPMLFVLLIHLLVKYRDPDPKATAKKKRGDSDHAA